MERQGGSNLGYDPGGADDGGMTCASSLLKSTAVEPTGDNVPRIPGCEQAGRRFNVTNNAKRAAGSDAPPVSTAETFGAGEVARAFEVEEARVHAAMRGEFGLGPDGEVDSRQAQQLAEVMLVDEPLDIREAKLMTLGAFTPRADDEWGLGDTTPGEESDRLSRSADEPEDVTPSTRASYDPAYTEEK